MNTNVRVRFYALLSIFFISTSAMGWSQPAQDKPTNDSTIKNVDVSILPFINVNSNGSANKTNISINIFAGYKQEVRKFEVGTLLNIVKDDAASCQLSGVGNLVLGTSKGFQAAGTFNIARNTTSVQLAGMLNATGNYKGRCQLAGVANVVGDTATGLQAAGTLNTAKTFNGCQMAGILNFTGGNMKGLQLAGVGNYAKTVDGTQISGIINIARYVKGVQLSVINISDSCKGVPIGIFSWVRKGYHKLELSTDELYFANLGFRTGTTGFHNNFLVGFRPDNFEAPLWNIGYGIGTSIKKSEKIAFDIDLSSQHIIKGHEFDFRNDLYKLYVGVDLRVSAKSSIAAGLSFNCLLSDTDSPQYEKSFSKLAPYHFVNKSFSNNNNLKCWIGAKIAFRFW